MELEEKSRDATRYQQQAQEAQGVLRGLRRDKEAAEEEARDWENRAVKAEGERAKIIRDGKVERARLAELEAQVDTLTQEVHRLQVKNESTVNDHNTQIQEKNDKIQELIDELLSKDTLID